MPSYPNTKIYLIGLSLFIILILSIIPSKIDFSNQADGFAYYLPLRSLLFDKNLNFSNENLAYGQTYHRLPYDWYHQTPTNLYHYPYSIGPSLLWLPTIFTLKTLSSIIISTTSSPTISLNLQTLEGFSNHYLQTLRLTNLIYGLLTLILTFLFLSKISPRNHFNNAISVIITALGTPFYYYLHHQPLTSHILSTFTSSLFLFISFTNFKQHLRYLYLGISLGLIFLVRWQDLIFIIIPLTEIIQSPFKLPHKIKHLTILLTGLIITISPQLLFWQTIYGYPITIPQGQDFFTFLPIHLHQFTFSFKHGLSSSHPIILISFIAFILYFHKHHYQKSIKQALVPCIVVLCISILVNSSLNDWHGSDSFGARRMVTYFPIFTLGLTFLFNSIKSRLAFSILIIICLILVIYNLYFAYLYSQNFLDHFQTIYPQQIFRNLLIHIHP